MRNSIFCGIFLTLILLVACSHGGNKVDNEQFAFLDSMGIAVTDRLLLGDSLTLPDIYCGDPDQTLDDLKGEKMSREQYNALVVPAGQDFADEMGN